MERGPNNSRPVPIGSKHKCGEGYVEIKTIDGWKYEHVYVLESYLGRKLDNGEVCHHCDRIRHNNNINNIELMLNSEHSILHGTGRVVSKETRLKIGKANTNNIPSSRKLTQDDADYIRTQYYYGGITQPDIARSVGISSRQISDIVLNKTYKRLIRSNNELM